MDDAFEGLFSTKIKFNYSELFKQGTFDISHPQICIMFMFLTWQNERYATMQHCHVATRGDVGCLCCVIHELTKTFSRSSTLHGGQKPYCDSE